VDSAEVVVNLVCVELEVGIGNRVLVCGVWIGIL
jgi:hypothetical protein